MDNVFSQGDKLREIGLNVPIVTRVFNKLKALGVDVNENVFTVTDAVNELKRIKAGDGNA